MPQRPIKQIVPQLDVVLLAAAIELQAVKAPRNNRIHVAKKARQVRAVVSAIAIVSYDEGEGVRWQVGVERSVEMSEW